MSAVDAEQRQQQTGYNCLEKESLSKKRREKKKGEGEELKSVSIVQSCSKWST